MARVSQLRGDYSFCRLYARCLLGGADVSVSARRTNLHYAMVFTWCVSLVPVALRGWPVNALRRPRAGSVAGGCRLGGREKFAFFGVGGGPARHCLLHDSQSDWSPGVQLSFGDDRLLELRAVLELDWDAAPRRWTVPGLDGPCHDCTHDPPAGSPPPRWAQSSHDDAGLFP